MSPLLKRGEWHGCAKGDSVCESLRLCLWQIHLPFTREAFILIRFYSSFIIGIFAAAASAGRIACFFRREEFVNRKVDVLECIAGVLRVAVAFSLRNTVIICRNKHLNISFKLNYAEKTESYKDCS